MAAGRAKTGSAVQTLYLIFDPGQALSYSFRRRTVEFFQRPILMRQMLSRLTACFVIAVALAMVPGAAAVRVSGRERDRGAARVTTTRGGSQRLDASDPTPHGHEETSPELADAGDLVVDSAAQSQAPTPAVPPAAFGGVPAPGAVLLVVPPVNGARAFVPLVHASGRAPPAR